MKPNQGGKGLGVKAFDTIDALEKTVADDDFPASVDDVWLVQEKIETSDDFITRLEFVGGRFVYGVRVYSGGSFELCPADVCEIPAGTYCPAEGNAVPEPANPAPRFEIHNDQDEVLVRKLEGFIALLGIEVAGIEFIRRPDGTAVIYDINTNTNYNAGAEKKAGIERGGMVRIAEFLSRELALAAKPAQPTRLAPAALQEPDPLQATY